MNYFFNTDKQLEKLDCGFSIQSFARAQNTKEIQWELSYVTKSKDDENRYFADYDCPNVPDCHLCFTCEITPEKHVCKITKLTIKGEAQNV